MIFCPIAEKARSRPNHFAIYSDEGVYTYEKLNQLIDQNEDETETFYADCSISSIVRFFSLIRQGRVAFPISKKEPILPNVNTSSVPNGIHTLIYTSGTIGRPKIAMHTIKHHVFSAKNQLKGVEMEPDDSYLLSLPINHISGIAILYRVFCSGASLIIGNKHRRLATHISFVPTQLKRFLQSSEHLCFNRLKCVLLGGAPIPKDLCDWAISHYIPLYITYGMSETASQIATMKYDPRCGVCFKEPLHGRDLKIDAQGQIWVAGMTLFKGYLNYESPIENGWFPTRDLGRIGKYGLEIIGRKDRMIISGGENIYLDELEAQFLSIPSVDSVIISSRKSEEFGCRPKAKIHVRDPISKKEIINHLQKVLPKYKIPDEEDISIH